MPFTFLVRVPSSRKWASLSYNDGTDQQNIAGVNKGNGRVIITLRR